MNTLSIKKSLREFQNNTSVVASDELPIEFTVPHGFIINLSPKRDPGSHWVALYIDENCVGEYMDSFGVPPRVPEIEYFINEKCISCDYNKICLQQYNSNVCGKYAVFFLYSRFKNNLFYKYFGLNRFINDYNVNKHFELLNNKIF